MPTPISTLALVLVLALMLPLTAHVHALNHWKAITRAHKQQRLQAHARADADADVDVKAEAGSGTTVASDNDLVCACLHAQPWPWAAPNVACAGCGAPVGAVHSPAQVRKLCETTVYSVAHRRYSRRHAAALGVALGDICTSAAAVAKLNLQNINGMNNLNANRFGFEVEVDTARFAANNLVKNDVVAVTVAKSPTTNTPLLKVEIDGSAGGYYCELVFGPLPVTLSAVKLMHALVGHFVAAIAAVLAAGGPHTIGAVITHYNGLIAAAVDVQQKPFKLVADTTLHVGSGLTRNNQLLVAYPAGGTNLQTNYDLPLENIGSQAGGPDYSHFSQSGNYQALVAACRAAAHRILTGSKKFTHAVPPLGNDCELKGFWTHWCLTLVGQAVHTNAVGTPNVIKSWYEELVKVNAGVLPNSMAPNKQAALLAFMAPYRIANNKVPNAVANAIEAELVARGFDDPHSRWPFLDQTGSLHPWAVFQPALRALIVNRLTAMQPFNVAPPTAGVLPSIPRAMRTFVVVEERRSANRLNTLFRIGAPDHDLMTGITELTSAQNNFAC